MTVLSTSVPAVVTAPRRVETLEPGLTQYQTFYYAAGHGGWCGPLRADKLAAYRDLDLHEQAHAATKDEQR